MIVYWTFLRLIIIGDPMLLVLCQTKLNYWPSQIPTHYSVHREDTVFKEIWYFVIEQHDRLSFKWSQILTADVETTQISFFLLQ